MIVGVLAGLLLGIAGALAADARAVHEVQLGGGVEGWPFLGVVSLP